MEVDSCDEYWKGRVPHGAGGCASVAVSSQDAAENHAVAVDDKWPQKAVKERDSGDVEIRHEAGALYAGAAMNVNGRGGVYPRYSWTLELSQPASWRNL